MGRKQKIDLVLCKAGMLQLFQEDWSLAMEKSQQKAPIFVDFHTCESKGTLPPENKALLGDY